MNKNLFGLLVLIISLFGLISCFNEGIRPNESDSQSGFETSGESEDEDPMREDLLYLDFESFDGNKVVDAAGKQKNTKIEYVFTKATYKGNEELPLRDGVSGKGLFFDGYSICASYKGFAMPTDAFTISVWVAPRIWSYPNGEIKAILCQTSGDRSGFMIGYGDFGKLHISFHIETPDGVVLGQSLGDGEAYLSLYEWTQIAVTFDGDKGVASLYLNGELFDSRNFDKGSRLKASAFPLYIGKNPTASLYADVFSLGMFTGVMDEVRISLGAESAEDIGKRYASFLSKEGEHPSCSFENVWTDSTLLDDDIYRPQYHLTPSLFRMGEPNAPFYFNGKYHIFVQYHGTATPTGPTATSSGARWLHFVSEDMVNWEELPPAIIPEENSPDYSHCFSGNALISSDGTPYIFYSAIDLRKGRSGCIAFAKAKDPTDPYLTEWEKGGVVLEQPADALDGLFRDPFFYEENGVVYMVVAVTRENKSQVLLYTASKDNLEKWTFKSVLYERSFSWDSIGSLSYYWELPMFMKIKSGDGSVEKYMLCITPMYDANHVGVIDSSPQYWLGEFDLETGIFTPDFDEPKKMDAARYIFCGPTAFYSAEGDAILWCALGVYPQGESNVYQAGWGNATALARKLSLDCDSNLIVEAYEGYESLHGELLGSLEGVHFSEAAEALSSVRGDMLHIRLTMTIDAAEKAGIKVRVGSYQGKHEETRIYYNAKTGKVCIDTTDSTVRSGWGERTVVSGEAKTSNGVLTLDIYLDRSAVEVFSNSSYSYSAAIYPALSDSLGVELYAVGGDPMIESLVIYDMNHA